jgi:heterodisulfide reductase subunit A
MMQAKVVVVGGGVAGMQTALRLKECGVTPIIIEREAMLGGKVRNWHRLFPSFTPAEEVVNELIRRVGAARIEVRTGQSVASIEFDCVTLADGRHVECDAVALCSGSTIFDARIKEEYGYGIYDNVVTSVDVERMLNEGGVRMTDGSVPQRIAILHCVGSRDEKVCQRHCSKVCCVTGVKQAIELKKACPGVEVFNFYMDMRMFGPGYEELYREAQQNYNVHFVRGRISEASQLMEGRVQIKAEDTLTGRPLRMSVDMLVLMVGMQANGDNPFMASSAGLQLSESGFVASRDMFLDNVATHNPRIFVAGTVTAPKTIGESLTEAVAAADRIVNYLNTLE